MFFYFLYSLLHKSLQSIKVHTLLYLKYFKFSTTEFMIFKRGLFSYNKYKASKIKNKILFISTIILYNRAHISRIDTNL